MNLISVLLESVLLNINAFHRLNDCIYLKCEASDSLLKTIHTIPDLDTIKIDAKGLTDSDSIEFLLWFQRGVSIDRLMFVFVL